MGFSRQEYWSRLPCPPPGDLPNPRIKPRSPSLQADSLPSEPPEKPKNTGVGSLSLLSQIFLTQELNRGLLCCRRIVYQLRYEGSPLNSKESFKHLLDSVPWGSFPFTAPTVPSEAAAEPRHWALLHISDCVHAASSTYKAFFPCTPVNVFPLYSVLNGLQLSSTQVPSLPREKRSPLCFLRTVCKTWEHPTCPSRDEPTQKRWCVYTTEHFSAIKGMKRCHWQQQEGPREYYTKWSQRQRQISHDITHILNLKIKNDANDLTYKAEIKPETKKENLQLLRGKGMEG